MAFFKWLFGRERASSAQSPSSANPWTVSENGNPTLVGGSTRITVFQQDRGWKYCIADVGDREDPHFSEAYATEREAREEALAQFRGEPSRHQTLSVSSAEDRRQRWEAHIQVRSLTIEELQRVLAENNDLGITALRKPEAKIASHLKQLDWQIAQYRNAGVSANLISLAERQKPALVRLAEEVAARIEIKQAKRPLNRTAVSDSQLSIELFQKVDDLNRLFADTPVVDPSEVEIRYSKANGSYPFTDQTSILPCAHMMCVIDPAWERMVIHGASAALQPSAEIIPLTLREPCPACGGPMRIIEIFRRGQKPRSRAPPRE